MKYFIDMSPSPARPGYGGDTVFRVVNGAGQQLATFADADHAQVFVNALCYLDELDARKALTVTDMGRRLRYRTTME